MKINLWSKGVDRGTSSPLYKQALGTSASCFISVCGGFTFGITAVMLPQLMVDRALQVDRSHYSWIASISIIGMVIGSLASGSILDTYGRKLTHIILSIPYIVGWVFIAAANSPTLILIGRFITGLSSGANRSITLIYVGEITDPKIRSIALFIPGFVSHLGVLVSHLMGSYLSWRTAAYICIAPPVISLMIFRFLKESPLWLISKGRIQEGTEVFRWFRGTGEEAENELKTVLERQSENPIITIKDTFDTICSTSFIKPMFIILILMINIQFSGVVVVQFYALDIFENTFCGNVDGFTMMVATDCIRCLMSATTCCAGKFIPRKKAFLAAGFGVTISLFGLIACLKINFGAIWIPVSCIVIYISLSSAIVTIGWSFVPEVLPSKARGLGSGLMSAVSFGLLFLVVKNTPSLNAMYGELAMYAFFAISTLICAVILIFALPETNGRTLQSIEDGFNKSNNDQTKL